ncbi:hypothetical protein EJB05_55355, partial [Eragrostis curvula]
GPGFSGGVRRRGPVFPGGARRRGPVFPGGARRRPVFPGDGDPASPGPARAVWKEGGLDLELGGGGLDLKVGGDGQYLELVGGGLDLRVLISSSPAVSSAQFVDLLVMMHLFASKPNDWHRQQGFFFNHFSNISEPWLLAWTLYCLAYFSHGVPMQFWSQPFSPIEGVLSTYLVILFLISI